VDGGSEAFGEQSVGRKKEEEARRGSHHCTSATPNQLKKKEKTLEEFDINWDRKASCV